LLTAASYAASLKINKNDKETINFLVIVVLAISLKCFNIDIDLFVLLLTQISYLRALKWQ